MLNRCTTCQQLITDSALADECEACYLIRRAQTDGLTFTQERNAIRAAKRYERCGFRTHVEPAGVRSGFCRGGYRLTIHA